MKRPVISSDFTSNKNNMGDSVSSEQTSKQENKETGFAKRHLGPSSGEVYAMLDKLSYQEMDSFIADVLPDQIKASSELVLTDTKKPLSEDEALQWFKEIAEENQVVRSYVGCGYYGTKVPTVIQRNILENPGWYTQYTPYQPEISQGRLEALLNFQTLVSNLTGLEIANASLLDEGTAAAEAMYLAYNVASRKKPEAREFFIDQNIFPQTLAVIKTRARTLGIKIIIGDYREVEKFDSYFATLIQYPAANGEVCNYQNFLKEAKSQKCLNIMACDLMSLCLLKSPGELGADIALGSAQRMGVPMGFGGPHAAFFACQKEFQRLIPGRLIGVSKDRLGTPAMRLSLQTREQHIRREKATSNICTAQVLLAIMSSMYAVYHGPKNLLRIANRIHNYTANLKEILEASGVQVKNKNFFDTLEIELSEKEGDLQQDILERAAEVQINLGQWKAGSLIIALDQTVSQKDLEDLVYIFTGERKASNGRAALLPKELLRTDDILPHEVFNKYHSETEFLRYIKRLEARDLSLAVSMIPLGSCTMKLNATTEMLPITWPEFSKLHPFAPAEQTKGYQKLIGNLEQALAEITGFDCVSLQPNAGSQGEYAGLIAIKSYLEFKGEAQRNICLIPKSAHGTNPASAVIAGLKVVIVNCDDDGNIDLEDLKAKASEYAKELAALMITYPSTHGVFEQEIKTICQTIHEEGGQVYLDGANLNAMVGVAFPAELGPDVMHINLHKTFCIPHGGGGPGVGPIAGKEHLREFMPSHPFMTDYLENKGYGPVSAAPWGSASILPISMSYIKMMGATGLAKATQLAILNANYIAKTLEDYYPVLYRGKNNFVAHECILDCRGFKEFGIEVEDIAKRLMDYGFHAPTVSWPVAGTMMIEPTESESKAEMDRFCQALIMIHGEIMRVESGEFSREDNPLKNAPHTAVEVVADEWKHPYSRELAAYPVDHLRSNKFWPAVARIDSVYGDRNLVCSCPDINDFDS